MANKTKLEVRNAKISFWTNNGYVRAVRDVSFNLEEGKTLAIVGESGSGKSVTARAILGILAGNATVEDGEIYYDGKDLLQIPEEVFHDIRGNNIAMIFQDPLSSLNPIVRVGKQLTEAILANNVTQRKQSKKNYKELAKVLQDNMILAGEDGAKVKESMSKFTGYISEGCRLERAYNIAHDTAETTISYIDGAKIQLIDKPVAEVAQEIKRIVQYSKSCGNVFLIPSDNPAFVSAVEDLSVVAGKYKMSKGSETDKAEVEAALGAVKVILQNGLERHKPDFVALGYYSLQKGKEEFASKDIKLLNDTAKKLFEEEFLDNFLLMVCKAVEYSNNKSAGDKKTAISKIQETLNILQGKIDVNSVSDTCNKLKPIVKEAIDKLDLHKNGFAYTFEGSIDNAIFIYKMSLKAENMTGKSKANLIKKFRLPTGVTLDRLEGKIRDILIKLKASFEDKLEKNANLDVKDRAEKVLKAMTLEASKMNYKMEYSLAKTRSIDLMNEVGIPQARQRFMQYPFQFSGGMRQRIVIAIALASNPDILICDEPTTALDVTIQAQILELINELKRERNLSIIFITHDLGVVANMADEIAVMYAGKIIEYGSVDEVFYEPAHPYTWALLSSMPDLDTKEKLEAIPGVPPNMIFPPKGDAFAQRNKYAMEIDFEEEPPMFEITPTHKAATWLLHPDAPKDIEPPLIVTDRIRRMKEKMGGQNE